MPMAAKEPRYQCLLLTMMVLTLLFMTAGPQIVSAVNNPPVITSVLPENGTVYQWGDTVGLEADAYDPDGDDLTYVWREPSLSIEHGHSADVDLRYMHPGEHYLILEVSDGNASVYRGLNFIVEGEIEDDDEGSSSPIDLWVAIVIGFVMIIVVIVVAAWMRMRR